MVMYKCMNKKCGQEFITPAELYVKEIYTDIDPPNVRTTTEQSCPYCGYDYIEEGETCSECGEHFAEYNGLCAECYEKVGNAVERYAKENGLSLADAKESFCQWAELNW